MQENALMAWGGGSLTLDTPPLNQLIIVRTKRAGERGSVCSSVNPVVILKLKVSFSPAKRAKTGWHWWGGGGRWNVVEIHNL